MDRSDKSRIARLYPERIRTFPVLLLITFRPEFSAPWIGQPHVTALGLSRLDARASAALAGNVTGNRVLPSVLIAEIVDRADGIPLFLEELTRTVVEADASEAGDVVTAVPSAVIAIPATLYASLAARLDRLGPAKEVAQISQPIRRQHDATRESGCRTS